MNQVKPLADLPSGDFYDKARIILENALDTAASFLQIFEHTRQQRTAKGTPTDEEQDLLRAMLIFASSGLDSMAKQLVREALPRVVESDEGSEKMFQKFVTRKITQSEGVDQSLLAEVIADRHPRDRLIQYMIADLVSGSLQSVSELMKVASYFNIPPNNLVRKEEQDDMKRIFDARNEIIHEMDVDFSQPNRNRRPRGKKKMIDDTNLIFSVAARFLRDVAAKIEGRCLIVNRKRGSGADPRGDVIGTGKML